MAERFLSAWGWAVQHEDNLSSKGLSRFTASLPSWYAYVRTRGDGGQTTLHAHRSSLIRTSGPSSLDSVATRGDPHGTKCMVARGAIPISTEGSTPRTKSFATQRSALMRKLQVKLPACVRSSCL